MPSPVSIVPTKSGLTGKPIREIVDDGLSMDQTNASTTVTVYLGEVLVLPHLLMCFLHSNAWQTWQEVTSCQDAHLQEGVM